MHWTCCSCGIAVQADDVGTLFAARWRPVDPTLETLETSAMLCPVCGEPPSNPSMSQPVQRDRRGRRDIDGVDVGPHGDPDKMIGSGEGARRQPFALVP